MSPQKNTTVLPESSGAGLLAIFRDRLVAERARLNEEIGSYPVPIPACDAQFNHLLGQRNRLSSRLNLVDQLLANHVTGDSGAQGIEELVEKMRRLNAEMASHFITVFNIDPAR